MFTHQLNQSQLPPNIVYLASDYPVHACTVSAPEQFSNTNLLLEIYQQRARGMVDAAATEYTENLREGMDSDLARNECSIDWIDAARVSLSPSCSKLYAEFLLLVGLSYRLTAILWC